MALVQIAANSEAQASDVLRVANAMISQRMRDGLGVDAGQTRTQLDDGGRIELLTSSMKTAEGDPATAIFLNESHHMTSSNGGHALAAVARRNVAKSPNGQARVLELTNAHEEGGNSVAEQGYLAWQAQVSGQAKRADILYDSREAAPGLDMYNDDDRQRGLSDAYSDSPWNDIERIEDDVLDPRTTVSEALRFYFNLVAANETAWVEPRKFDAGALVDEVVADREQLAMFLDCSKSSDATALVACRVSDGHILTLGVWQKPHGERGKDWLAPRHEVDAAVRMAVDRYSVLWFGVDPSPARDDETEALYWADLLDAWHRDFRRKLLLWATPGRDGSAVRFDMRMSSSGGALRNQQFTEAAMLTAADIDENGKVDENGQALPLRLTHDGHPALRMHVHNARRRPNQWGVTLGKANRESPRLVDLAVSMVGARLGRRLLLNSDKLTARRRGPSMIGY